MARLMIVTDAWHPQVNGVVRTLDRLSQELGTLGFGVHLLTPEGFATVPLPSYPGIRSALATVKAIADRIEALDPDFIVADESVSALDVSIQAQVLNLLLDIRDRRGLTMLFIAHDLSVVEYLCDSIAVMYLGRLVEVGSADAVYSAPAHPYTRALLSAIPEPEPGASRGRELLQGDIPSPLAPPSGCVFRTRCRFATPDCAQAIPPLTPFGDGRSAACIRLTEIS